MPKNANNAIGADITIVMAVQNHKDSERVAVDPSLLEWAEYWYPISWKGVLGGGIITAVGACATIAFLLLQWRTTSIREEQADWRTTVVESDTAKAKADLGIAQADIAKANAQIAIAHERTAEAVQRAAEAQRDLERERMERLRQGPRTIKPEQAEKLKAALQGFPTQILIVATNENEADLYGQQITKAVREAGIPVQMDYGDGVPGETVGLFVAEGRDDPEAIRLTAILNDSGIKTSPQMRKWFIKRWQETYRGNSAFPRYPYDGCTLIFVGHKPARND